MTGLVKRLLSCGAKSFAAGRDQRCLPEGHIWVNVGRETERPRRFELETNFLKHPLFEDLLQLSVVEFGYSYKGALRIACEADLFLHLLALLRSSNPAVHYMELQDLVDRFHASGSGGDGVGGGRPEECLHKRQ